MWKAVSTWVGRVLSTLWACWLAFKHILGLPGDLDAAHQWQRWLQEWGFWNALIDPYPWVFFAALAIALWSWDVHRKLPDLFRRGHEIEVTLRPSSGPSPEQLLEVMNNGPTDTFTAQYRILKVRNDPNPMTQPGTCQMPWSGHDGESVTLQTGEARCLLVATHELWRKHDLGEIRLWSYDANSRDKRKLVTSSQWNMPQEELPEYDVAITIRAKNSEDSESRDYTVKPRSRFGGLEMLPVHTQDGSSRSGERRGDTESSGAADAVIQPTSRAHENKTKWYEYGGLLWRIDSDFVCGYDEYQVGDLWSGAVSNLISGPHCQYCARDVAQSEQASCPGCGKDFPADGALLLQLKEEYMDTVKCEILKDFQAAMRRGENPGAEIKT